MKAWSRLSWKQKMGLASIFGESSPFSCRTYVYFTTYRFELTYCLGLFPYSLLTIQDAYSRQKLWSSYRLLHVMSVWIRMLSTDIRLWILCWLNNTFTRIFVEFCMANSIIDGLSTIDIIQHVVLLTPLEWLLTPLVSPLWFWLLEDKPGLKNWPHQNC